MARRRRSKAFRYRGRRRQYPLLVVVLLLIVAAMRWWPGDVEPDASQDPAFLGELREGVYPVRRVIDGDTFVLANGAKIRLIAADTPESYGQQEPYGPEATEFTRRFLSGGNVRLQFDGRRKDKYQRFLAHVWVDGEMLSEELVRAGLLPIISQDIDRAVTRSGRDNAATFVHVDCVNAMACWQAK